MGRKTGQKSACSWNHARASDTAVRVPVVKTTASPWYGLSMPLFLDFWGSFFGPSLAWLRAMDDPMGASIRYHMLTTCTYIYTFELGTRHSLSFPVVYEYYEVSLHCKDFRYIHCL